MPNVQFHTDPAPEKPSLLKRFGAELSYFWKRQRAAVLGWSIFLLLFLSFLGLWSWCGSLTGVYHFFLNGFSRDGDFVQKPVRRGEMYGQKRVFDVEGVEFVFRWCPSGNFRMGSPEKEQGRDPDEALHRVKLTGFWVLETEVTREMWALVMGTEPPDEKDALLPVADVSWDQAMEFCEKLGRKIQYRVQLPTEAQWEYACRAGSERPFCGGDLDQMGWYEKNSRGRLHPVKKRRHNAWFLYDFHGNVAEWCRDGYDVDYYAKSPEENPPGPYFSRKKVVRGGDFTSPASKCRAAERGASGVGEAGFRVVVEYVKPKK